MCLKMLRGICGGKSPRRAMHKAAVFAVFFCGITAAAPAGELFKVLAVNGGVMLRRAAERTPLKAGQSVAAGDEIEIAGGGFAGLVTPAGRPVELRSTGVFKAGELARKHSGTTGVAQKFAAYVTAQMMQQSGGSTRQNYQTKMESTGAVERATNDRVDIVGKTVELAGGEKTGQLPAEPEQLPERMQALMPRTGKVMDLRLDFSWKPEPGVGRYSLLIRDRDFNIVFEEDITGKRLSVNLAPLALKPDECYFWSVRPDAADDSRRSEEYALCIMPAAEQRAVADSVRLLTEELGTLQTATAQMILAAFYEQNEIFTRADRCYREAARLAPDVADIAVAHRRFLARLGVEE